MPHPAQTPGAAEPLPLGRLLYRLFFDPSVFIQLQSRRLSATVLVVLGLCLVSGLLIGASRLPEVRRNTIAWKAWLQDEVKDLGVSDDGRLTWTQPADLPYRTRIRDWRVDVSRAETFPDDSFFAGPLQRGVWISDQDIYIWARQRSDEHDGKLRAFKFLSGGELITRLAGESASLPLDREVLGVLTDEIGLLIAIMVVCVQIFAVSMVVMLVPLFAAIIATMTAAMSVGHQPRAPYSRIAVLYLYTSVPPVAVATVYSCLQLPSLDFLTVFILAFVCYHLYVMRSLRSLLTGNQPR